MDFFRLGSLFGMKMRLKKIILLFFILSEEILEQSRATWFSKNGGNLLYVTFNASSVGEVAFKLYGDDPKDFSSSNFEENSNDLKSGSNCKH